MNQLIKWKEQHIDMKKNIDIIELIPPSVWRQIIGKYSFSLTDEKRLKFSIINFMHNRHVGITPELAELLAYIIFHPGAQQKKGGVWSLVLERLMKELELGKRRLGIVFQANSAYTVFRIAMPVIEKACALIGQCCLFCEDEDVSNIDQIMYEEYALNLSNHIKQITTENKNNELFWKERALSLTSFSSMIKTRKTFVSLPDIDTASLSFFLSLEPDIPKKKQNIQHIRDLPILHKHRKIKKLKEEGIEGIHITREPEAINDILISEFINPEIILLDRLINTGYLAFKREPKREKLKDALIVAIIPWDVTNNLKIDFIKTCWFNCMMHLSILLREKKLQRSEFVWIEGDKFNNARFGNFSLEQMHLTAIKDKANKSYRNIFLTSLRWMPFYYDRYSNYTQVTKEKMEDDPEKTQEKIYNLKQWAGNAWKMQTKNISWFSKKPIDNINKNIIKKHILLAQ